MKIKLKVVRSRRTLAKLTDAMVLAIAEGFVVKFTPRDGYTCNCEEEGESCSHVDSVDELVDDSVFVEPDDLTPARSARRRRVPSERA